jgi:hypothetical protein
VTIIAIDPGPTQSAVLVFDGAYPDQPISRAEILPNDRVLREMRLNLRQHTVIEMVASYGMAVGKDVFETVYWIGRFAQAAPSHDRIFRLDCKMHLCHDSRAKDTNIRQALIDRFPATGGGKVPQVGTKAQPGPLYGIKSHLWAALAVAVTWSDRHASRL